MSDRTMRGVGSGSLAASAGSANLPGPVVSSRTENDHSSSDAAGHHRTGLVPSTATTRRGTQNPATTSNTATKQRNAGNSGYKADQSRTAAKQQHARVAPSL
ncbi:hypothetical protein ABH935_004263 [Catenulispora sp. GAS73]|uniref:hypothetical protein n=1 Tax=Catenulispora sp. GAS73 TaxID=3156269 RepID=UPI003513500D